MTAFFRRRRPARWRQCVFSFLERAERRQRRFKCAILVFTTLAIALVLELTSEGRYVLASLAFQARNVARFSIGVPTPRSEIDLRWRLFRERGVAGAGRSLEQVFAGMEPPYRRLMTYAGLDPEHCLVRWGNYDKTMLLPSTVFEADDSGRAYRLRPNQRSVWLRNIDWPGGLSLFFLVPDRPELLAAMDGTTARIVEGSRQTTNSWGLRGREPDPAAPLRGIVLGDSYMQGLMIGDDQTPPAALERHLEARLQTKTSVLNTGLLGYSPEQYYYSLLAYADRFRPQFVVVSVFVNDFGNTQDALDGKVDWQESTYWLNRITEFCRQRRFTHLFVFVPLKVQILGKRASGFYPGTISNRLETNGTHFLNPIETFVDTHLSLTNQSKRPGGKIYNSPLFNDHLSDGHFSELGSTLWARLVAERLGELLEREGVLLRTDRPIGPHFRLSSRAP
jgi:hypothetical protein